MNKSLFSPALILLSIIALSCTGTKKSTSIGGRSVSAVTGPKAIIYQTKKDYNKLVPIILSKDKKTVVSYPDVRDVFFKGSLAYPTQLHKGFLLDNRGIDQNVAFINMTYEDYSKLSKTPNASELIMMVIDKDPLIKMYACGTRSMYQDIENELNALIDANKLEGFDKLK